MDYDTESMRVHKELKGKLEVRSKLSISSRDDLSIAYTPGVGAVSSAIAKDPSVALTHTLKGNTVAVISNGSAVLGLGDIGPLAALPVMEGKSLLMKEFAGLDSFPIVIDNKDAESIINTVRSIAPTFAAINLEDIKAPICFEVEDALQDIGIPVFHDDQHGTAIVVLAGLINSAKVAGKELSSLRVVINGAGAAGSAIAKLLSPVVDDVLVIDSKGVISSDRDDLNKYKRSLLDVTNKDDFSGTLSSALLGSDVFVGVSRPGILTGEMVKSMNVNPFVFALSNPVPEIMPDLAKNAGALIVATGRSDFPNQINNVLAFPGIFRGAIDVGAKRITEKMKLAAAHALAGHIRNPSVDEVLPSPLDKTVSSEIARAVADAYIEN